MKTIRIGLLILIVIGLGLIVTQKFWVGKVVDYIMLNTSDKNIQKNIQGQYVAPESVPGSQDSKQDLPTVSAKSGIAGTVTTSPVSGRIEQLTQRARALCRKR